MNRLPVLMKVPDGVPVAVIGLVKMMEIIHGDFAHSQSRSVGSRSGGLGVIECLLATGPMPRNRWPTPPSHKLRSKIQAAFEALAPSTPYSSQKAYLVLSMGIVNTPYLRGLILT